MDWGKVKTLLDVIESASRHGKPAEHIAHAAARELGTIQDDRIEHLKEREDRALQAAASAQQAHKDLESAHEEALAEIERLRAEVERLTNESKAGSGSSPIPRSVIREGNPAPATAQDLDE
jgi:chromosome segregation ATPase